MSACSSFFIVFAILFVNVFSQNGELYCNSNNTFKIIQFTDCHFGESSSKDSESINSFVSLLNYENPDLITLSGDFISGYAYNGTKGWFKDTFNYAMKPILSSNIPWAYTLGNHDDEADWNRTQIISYASTLSNSYTYLGPNNIGGTSNYVLTIFNKDKKPIINI